jgi:hypothetical protein
MEQEDRLTEAATVPRLNPDTEGILIGQQQWEAVHERAFVARLPWKLRGSVL